MTSTSLGKIIFVIIRSFTKKKKNFTLDNIYKFYVSKQNINPKDEPTKVKY